MSAVEWDALPEPVRGRLVEYAAAALSDLSKMDIPPKLRPVARFAPAKRARIAAAALLASLSEATGFRAAVIAWLGEHRPAALDVGNADPIAAAAAAVLSEADDVASKLRAVADQVEEVSLKAERDAALARIQRLDVDLENLRAELAQEREALRVARSERESDLERLRNRLREQGVQLRQARDAEQQVREELAGAGSAGADEAAALALRLDKERQRADAERARADRVQREVDSVRRSAREAREADEVRLTLLADTLSAAVEGLRGELGLKPLADAGGDRPADTVAGASRRTGSIKTTDPAVLERLLLLPTVHVIVDGYNVTKTGYPELALADQRERLSRQLSALAARTSAEVTVVFDGAGVVAVPVTSVRGVRVLFSDPGVQADDVIRALVAAEPAGRPLVVVTSDQEIVRAVRECGAHPVPSVVFLARVGRV